MSNIKSNYLHQSQRVHTCMQTIAKELDRSPTSNKKFQVLTRKLDASFKTLDLIKEKSNSIFSKVATDSLELQLVSLYSRLIDAWVKNEVTQIGRKAMSLQRSLHQGKLTAEAVEILSQRLHAFKKDHRPLICERQVLAKAEYVIDCATAFLKGLPISEKPSTPKPSAFPGPHDLVVIEDLLDISVLVYQHQIQEAQKRYNQLPEEHKRRFVEHMQHLKATPFTDAIESAQGFIALANELACNGEGYPNRAQVDDFVIGLLQVRAQDSTRIFSLRSEESLGG